MFRTTLLSISCLQRTNEMVRLGAESNPGQSIRVGLIPIAPYVSHESTSNAELSHLSKHPSCRYTGSGHKLLTQERNRTQGDRYVSALMALLPIAPYAFHRSDRIRHTTSPTAGPDFLLCGLSPLDVVISQ